MSEFRLPDPSPSQSPRDVHDQGLLGPDSVSLALDGARHPTVVVMTTARPAHDVVVHVQRRHLTVTAPDFRAEGRDINPQTIRDVFLDPKRASVDVLFAGGLDSPVARRARIAAQIN